MNKTPIETLTDEELSMLYLRNFGATQVLPPIGVLRNLLDDTHTYLVQKEQQAKVLTDARERFLHVFKEATRLPDMHHILQWDLLGAIESYFAAWLRENGKKALEL